MAGVSYEDAIQKISKFKIVKDPPLIQIDEVWKTNSAIDLWMNIAPYVNSIEFNKLSASFDTIISNDNKKEISFLCKRGLFQTLAIVSYLANKVTFALSSNPQEFVDKIVYTVLSSGNWLKIHEVLPSLAEASPVVFMNAVKTSLAENHDSILELFDRKHGAAFTHLLWALESLMTSSDYLLQATILLGKLNALVPDTGMVNSPMDSLKNSFTPWYNQTFGTTKAKIAALNALAQSDPGVAFNLFSQLLKTSSASPLYKFNWKLDYGTLKVEQTFEAVRELGLFLIRKLILLSKRSDSRVVALIDIYNITETEDRQKILSAIKARLVKAKSNLIWNALREYLERQKSWDQISQKEIEELEEVLTLYEPQDLILKNQFLFERTPWLIRGKSKKKDTWKKNALVVHKKRISAAKEIYRDCGIIGLTKLIEVSTVYNLRFIANACRLSKPDEIKVFSWLTSTVSDDKMRIFAQQYIANRSVTTDNWASQTIKRLKADIKDLRLLIQFILCLPQKREFWNLIEDESEKIQYEYWDSIFPTFYSLSDEDIQYLIKKMQSAQRHIVLLNCYVREFENISTPKLFELFNNAIRNAPAKKNAIDWNEVHPAFENLQLRNDVHEDDMVQLELKYLDFLTGWHVEVRPIFTYKKMLQSPDFFVELIKEVKDIYQIENYDVYNQDDLAGLFRKASNYNSLIDHWNTIPGMKENGNIDGNILNRWVNKALKLTIGDDKLKYRVEHEIGEIFGRCSRRKSDWPQKQICAILDRTQSDTMLSSFRTAIFNSRGVSVRMPYDGGEQERALSKFFKGASDKIRDKYPFTASALASLSKSYERDTNREDDKAQLEELLR